MISIGFLKVTFGLIGCKFPPIRRLKVIVLKDASGLGVIVLVIPAEIAAGNTGAGVNSGVGEARGVCV